MGIITIISYGSFITPQDTLERNAGIYAEIVLRLYRAKNNQSKCYIIRQAFPKIDEADKFCEEQIDLMNELGYKIRFSESNPEIKTTFNDFIILPTITQIHESHL